MSSTVQDVAIGSLTLRIGKLTLGQLRRDETLLEAFGKLQQLSKIAKSGGLPTPDQFQMMVRVIVGAAMPHTPGVTAEAIEAAIDETDFDVGFKLLSECVGIATYGRRLTKAADDGGLSSGEAAGPSSSISGDSTGSSPLPAVGDSAISTS